ncbi:unnamed protein product, partial [Adineta steineri]
FAWLITGSVWVFGAKANGVQGDNPNATNTYCQSDLYKSAFVLLIINYKCRLQSITETRKSFINHLQEQFNQYFLTVPIVFIILALLIRY